MPLPVTALGDAPAELVALAIGALAAYLAALGAAVLRRPGLARGLVAAGAAAQSVLLAIRGFRGGFIPLTSRYESLMAAALATALVALATWQPRRIRAATMIAATAALTAGALQFSQRIVPAALPLRSIWYPLHVPLSFLAYGLWAAAAADGLAWFRSRDGEWLPRIERRALQGFGVWSLSMIFGGIWGVAVWGAYFLWDPKIIWSVVLWCHYAGFVHLRYSPFARERPWLAPLLAEVGWFYVFVAFIGTSHFFGGSSHAF